MTVTEMTPRGGREELDYREERADLAAAFRWTARWNMHEGVSNHYSLAVTDDGSKFLMNPDIVDKLVRKSVLGVRFY